MSFIGTHGTNPNFAQAARTYRHARPKIPQVGLHTSESAAGSFLLALWQFIHTRLGPGSYNAGADVYGTANQYAPWSWYTWHAPAINPFAAGITANCRADEWDRISKTWRDNLIKGMARMAHQYSRWCVSQGLAPVPARYITGAQARAGHWGFVYHGSLQSDRTDPTGPRDVFPALSSWPSSSASKPEQPAPPRINSHPGRNRHVRRRSLAPPWPRPRERRPLDQRQPARPCARVFREHLVTDAQ
ncbi:hypothetical protein [Nesterenkonia pannonica]|uniref:hypothetical protein n=1 Tax=Nesterenkonia pannonica TaxID=1548602 RepID=UPI0021645214|nr:hypothetical protein [Nesterenkonia pannonica]